MSFKKPDFQPRTMPKDEFFAKAEALTEEEMSQLGLGKKEKTPDLEKENPLIKASWKNPETGQEQTIEINLEKIMDEQKTFYRDRLNLEIDESEIISIWNKNRSEIKSEIEKYGYDEILIIPNNLPSEADLNQRIINPMDEGAGKGKVVDTKYWIDQQSISSIGENKYRIILVHSAQNLADHPLLKATKRKNIMDLTGIDKAKVEGAIAGGHKLDVYFKAQIGGQEMEIKADSLSLREYEIFQAIYFKKTGQHLDESGWTWLLKSRSGSRVVSSRWSPGVRRLYVDVDDPDSAIGDLGLRLSRSFSS